MTKPGSALGSAAICSAGWSTVKNCPRDDLSAQSRREASGHSAARCGSFYEGLLTCRTERVHARTALTRPLEIATTQPVREGSADSGVISSGRSSPARSRQTRRHDCRDETGETCYRVCF